MTYLWIGIGGALGSIARAWLAVAVARITGPQFPWGTILINIIGSFIISFFGTLTANDSRFAAAADLRAFVMVGLCGGFTTFSSFSLQTLELARDGRVAQAAGNVCLSVVLCLLAVTAGYMSADGIQRAQSAAAVEPPRQGTLVLLHRAEDARGLIKAAVQLQVLDGLGEVRAVIMHPTDAPLLPSEDVMTASRAADLRAGRDDAIAGLRQAARDAMEDIARHGTLLEADGASVARHMASVRLVVAPRPRAGDGEHIHQAVQAAVFGSGCPVLLLPPNGCGELGRVVAVAWNDDARVRVALRDALPLLQAADRVHVLCDAGITALPPMLTEAGIRASLQALPDSSGSVGERLLAATHALGADLLVMGAFTHGPWREGVFGGVTRTMLASADLPLLVRH